MKIIGEVSSPVKKFSMQGQQGSSSRLTTLKKASVESIGPIREAEEGSEKVELIRPDVIGLSPLSRDFVDPEVAFNIPREELREKETTIDNA